MSFMQDVENTEGSDVPLSQKEGADGRVYELGYLLVPTISPENVPINYGNLKDLIMKEGGEII